MSRQQVLQVGIAAVLVILFLVGCGSTAPTAVSEAPAATSTPEPPTDTPTPEPPAATPPRWPPTATPVEQAIATPTPEPPAATPPRWPPTATPESNLSKGNVLILGSHEANVIGVEEVATLPGLKLEAQPDMKFVVVKLNLSEFQGEVNSESFVLEAASGIQYFVTGGMMTTGTIGVPTAAGVGSLRLSGPSDIKITIGFEVPKDEKIDSLT